MEFTQVLKAWTNRKMKNFPKLVSNLPLIQNAVETWWFGLEVIVFIYTLLAHFLQLLFRLKTSQTDKLIKMFMVVVFFTQYRCVSVNVSIMPHGVQAAWKYIPARLPWDFFHRGNTLRSILPNILCSKQLYQPFTLILVELSNMKIISVQHFLKILHSCTLFFLKNYQRH